MASDKPCSTEPPGRQCNGQCKFQRPVSAIPMLAAPGCAVAMRSHTGNHGGVWPVRKVLGSSLASCPRGASLGVNRLGGSYVNVAVTGVRRVAVVVLWTGRSRCRHAGITPVNRSALRLQAQHRRRRRRPAIRSRHCPAGYVRDRPCRAR